MKCLDNPDIKAAINNINIDQGYSMPEKASPTQARFPEAAPCGLGRSSRRCTTDPGSPQPSPQTSDASHARASCRSQ